MTDRLDPAYAEQHARHAVAGGGTVVATSVVAALLDELDRTRVTVRELRGRCSCGARKSVR